jgi:thiol-disulfide isomerase/thioredoxin
MVPRYIYIAALLVTLLILGTVVYISSLVSGARIKELSGIEDRIATDILSAETQFELLSKISCEQFDRSVLLARELGEYGDRLTETESRLGSTNPEVLQLKKQYSLLEIKDYLLTERLNDACENDAVAVLYFYADDCEACTRAGYALSKLRSDYSTIRVYSFDLGLSLGAIDTLAFLHDISHEELPVFVIQGKKVSGFRTLEELVKEFPKESLATSTPQIQ